MRASFPQTRAPQSPRGRTPRTQGRWTRPPAPATPHRRLPPPPIQCPSRRYAGYHREDRHHHALDVQATAPRCPSGRHAGGMGIKGLPQVRHQRPPSVWGGGFCTPPPPPGAGAGPPRPRAAPAADDAGPTPAAAGVPPCRQGIRRASWAFLNGGPALLAAGSQPAASPHQSPCGWGILQKAHRSSFFFQPAAFSPEAGHPGQGWFSISNSGTILMNPENIDFASIKSRIAAPCENGSHVRQL